MLSEGMLEENSCYNNLLEPVEKELAYRKEFNIFITEE